MLMTGLSFTLHMTLKKSRICCMELLKTYLDKIITLYCKLRFVGCFKNGYLRLHSEFNNLSAALHDKGKLTNNDCKDTF